MSQSPNAPEVMQIGEAQLLVRFAETIDTALPARIAALSTSLKQRFGNALLELVPSYTTLLIEYHPLKLSPLELSTSIPTLWIQAQAVESVGTLHRLPVLYGSHYGPDLAALAQAKGLCPEEVIKLHTGRRYTICAIGFAPGFAFLGEVDNAIRHPRHSAPRLSIPKGSVGIAEAQTAVYPDTSPGGWQIIGNCPLTLFNPDNEPMTPFIAGDSVEFYQVTEEQFIELGGEPCPVWK
ncbi:5-oxoprolinase subunit PxpB [Shewanella submarina]|uniref:5-oxoprolinase subunit PxpB n=1 Tax=Shewanella submarina TaxID=2016376 RepID=A0ABV7GJ04_9GAMM|nr:5-oxoprolinase subunit PxpB [Shewanella submarina]MCL1035662.1 5-oxoprolinase subunit PxpB [Shewanella submarina]